MRCQYPWSLKVVRFVDNFLSFIQLNISRVDIRCVLGNGVGGAAQSTQPVIIYITINIIPSEDEVSPVEATMPGHIQFPTPERFLSLSHHQPVETGNNMPQSEEISPTGTKNPHFALHQADEAMKRIVPIDQSNTWERAVVRIKWVMDTLGPIAEVRIMLCRYPWLS